MNHLQHLQNNKDNLLIRSEATKAIRSFFWKDNFTEIEAPTILRLPGQEPYLSPMGLTVHDEKGDEYKAYLHTSPEYTMKKMLAAGFENIFCICKCFRDYESFGGLHNPEFCMIEWYRTNADMYDIMEDIENLFSYILENVKGVKFEEGDFERVHMKELWAEIGVELDNFLTKETMSDLCKERGYNILENESYEDLFYRIFLNEIEVKFKHRKKLIVHHYPAQMASLAKLSDEDPNYAERFEVYVDGVELANCFSELIDADEQLERLSKEKEERKQLGKDIYDIDIEFIDALRHGMPKCAGVSLGIDRFVQVLTDCKNIDNVITLPMSRLFEDK